MHGAEIAWGKGMPDTPGLISSLTSDKVIATMGERQCLAEDEMRLDTRC